MAGERLTLDPLTVDSANAPLELSQSTNDMGIFLTAHEYPAPELDSAFASTVDTEGDPLISNRYKNRAINVTCRVVEPSDGASTNLATNPKCGVDATGWTSSGLVSMTRATLEAPGYVAEVGADTGLHTLADGSGDYAYTSASVVSGQTYTLSAWVYLASSSATGVKLQVRNNSATDKASTSTFSTAEEWTRLSVTFTADSTSAWRFALEQVGSGSTEAYMTGVLIEESASEGSYFDGDYPGCQWTGGNHLSTSTRTAGGGSNHTRFYQSLSDLEQKCAKITSEGGVLRRILPSGYEVLFNILSATVDYKDDKMQMRGVTEASLTFIAEPFGYGSEQTKTLHTESTLPALIFTEQIETGDVPGLARLAITDLSGADQLSLIWGWRSLNYSAASTAGLLYEAESMTPLGTAAAKPGPTGASGSGDNSIFQHTLTTTYSSVMSTQAVSGGAHLSHVGTYRVFARMWRPFANDGVVSVALEWAQGDFQNTTINQPVIFGVTDRLAAWTFVDLGLIQISEIPKGAQQWEGRINAKSTVLGDDLYIDCLALFPVDESYGEIKVSPVIETPRTFVGRDEFDHSSGNLTGGQTTNAVSAATNAFPIVLTVTSHGLSNGNTVWVEGIKGNTAANGYWTVANKATDTFELAGSTGNGTWTSGGTVSKIGKTAPIGGGWYGSGDADDFTINTSSHLVQRTATKDTFGTGRYAILAAGSYANIAAGLDVHESKAQYDGEQSQLGMTLRYVDTNNNFRGLLSIVGGGLGTSTWEFLLLKKVGGTTTKLAEYSLGAFNDGDAISTTMFVTISASGIYQLWNGGVIKNTGRDTDLATGGALATGRVGLYDEYATSSEAKTRLYDNFYAYEPPLDAAIYGNQSIELRSDQIIRKNPTGTVWTPRRDYKGSYPKVPTKGREGRTLETIIKCSRGNVDTMADTDIDNISAQLYYTPRWLHIPRA